MSMQDSFFEGILLVDKPVGITSHDIVDRLRKKLRMKKIGHAGTLDPLATGLMIMLIGKATKVSQFLISLDKVTVVNSYWVLRQIAKMLMARLLLLSQ